MKKNIKKWSFTLIEIVVSITILSIIMISVMAIFINATDISRKSEINRVMQENIKNIVETISEDVRKNWIEWVSKESLHTCNLTLDTDSLYKKWDKLCTNENDYFLAKENATDDYTRVGVSSCSWIKDHCIIVKNTSPLSNSHVSIKDLKFYVSNDVIPKVTILMTLQPSIKKWVKTNLIEESKLHFQTTISTRNF